MTRNQIKQVEAAREGPRTRSKTAILEKTESSWTNEKQSSSNVKRQTVRWGSEENAVAEVLVSLKNTHVSVGTINRNSGANSKQSNNNSNSDNNQRPRRSCANY